MGTTAWFVTAHELNEAARAEAVPLQRTADGWRVAGEPEPVGAFQFIREQAAQHWRIALGFRSPTGIEASAVQPPHPLCDELEVMRLAAWSADRKQNVQRAMARPAVGELVNLGAVQFAAAKATGLTP